MIAVISVLSFVLAFGAIWFTSEALKRVDSYNDAKLRPHLLKVQQAANGVPQVSKDFHDQGCPTTAPSLSMTLSEWSAVVGLSPP